MQEARFATVFNLLFFELSYSLAELGFRDSDLELVQRLQSVSKP